jgi:uncharacterized protein YdcH (DUF465 family)
MIAITEQLRKNITAEAQPIWKQHRDAVAALGKAKERYWTKCREHETMETQLHEAQKSEDQKRRAKVPDIEKKLMRLKEDISEALASYKECLQNANAKQEWYRQRMPRLVGEYQMALRSRIDRLKDCMREFSSALQKSANSSSSLAPVLDKAIAGISADAALHVRAIQRKQRPVACANHTLLAAQGIGASGNSHHDVGGPGPCTDSGHGQITLWCAGGDTGRAAAAREQHGHQGSASGAAPRRVDHRAGRCPRKGRVQACRRYDRDQQLPRHGEPVWHLCAAH